MMAEDDGAAAAIPHATAAELALAAGDDLFHGVPEEEEEEPTAAADEPGASRSGKRKRGGGSMKKAPQAPKRFKSSYILFSMAKMEEAKKKGSADVTTVSREVSKEWKSLSAEEREKWEEDALQDKRRYMAEKQLYTGPWQVPSARTRKDPSAPKRPMSAFLFFSTEHRHRVKEEFPDMKNTEISRLLGERWNSILEEERRPYVEKEAKLREQYKKDIAVWRKKRDEKDRQEQKRRKEVVEQAIKSGAIVHGQDGGIIPPMVGQAVPPVMYPMYTPPMLLPPPGRQPTGNPMIIPPRPPPFLSGGGISPIVPLPGTFPPILAPQAVASQRIQSDAEMKGNQEGVQQQQPPTQQQNVDSIDSGVATNAQSLLCENAYVTSNEQGLSANIPLPAHMAPFYPYGAMPTLGAASYGAADQFISQRLQQTLPHAMLPPQEQGGVATLQNSGTDSSAGT